MIPSIADHVVCIDVDGTIYPLVGLMAAPRPYEGAVEAIQALHATGWRIVIFTSRVSPTWLKAEFGRCWKRARASQLDYLVSLLTRDGIPFDEITCEKVPAEWYIDDHSLRYRSWPAIAHRLGAEPRERTT